LLPLEREGVERGVMVLMEWLHRDDWVGMLLRRRELGAWEVDLRVVGLRVEDGDGKMVIPVHF
jgi:hypothetical protein